MPWSQLNHVRKRGPWPFAATVGFIISVLAFLFPLRCWSFPAGSNTGDAFPANHTTIETGREEHEQENLANITTIDLPAAEVAVEQARHAVARSLTSTQKQDLGPVSI